MGMEKPGQMNRRQFIATASTSSLGLLATQSFPFENKFSPEKIPAQTVKAGENSTWQVGIGRRCITPDDTGVWLAGYGRKRIAYGKIHDIWVKVLALKDPAGNRVVMATTDHMGMSKTVYERLYTNMKQQFGLERAEFMLTFSHNHCGPCLTDDLVDYYPSDAQQKKLVEQYTLWMEDQVVQAVGQALESWQDGQLFSGIGHCTFAVNRRDNIESEVPKLREENIPLQGVVDHDVPLLAIKGTGGHLLALLF